MEYKTYYENASTHKEIKKLIEKNYKNYHAKNPAKNNQIACNDTVKNRLFCVVMFEKNESTFLNRFAGNLVSYSGIGFTVIAVKIAGNSPYVFIGAFLVAGSLRKWAGTELNHFFNKTNDFGQSLKKNPKPHIIVYDIRDCNTDPQCPNYKPKNKSTKKPANLAKKTKS